MAQLVHFWIGDEEVQRELPPATNEVLPGVRWGDYWAPFTPAYWLSQYWMKGLDRVERSPYQARGDVVEELVFCMLGGFGITAELAMAAFEACSEAGLIDRREIEGTAWQEVLLHPLSVQGRLQRYRYPNQKARHIAAAMRHVVEFPLDQKDGRDLRDALIKIKGVGHKTAGWVARNCLDTDDVAILDIHLVRAGILCDIFNPKQKVERDYREMEERYLDFCHALSVRPAVMDCLMWDQMRTYGKIALNTLAHKLGKSSPLAIGPKAQGNLQPVY